MTVEEYAKRILAREMKQPVELHDDGGSPGMYDLRIGDPEAPDIAIECVGAVDPRRTETWNIGPARGPMQFAITGDWQIELTPTARIKAIRARLEPLLRICEERALVGFMATGMELRWADRALDSAFNRLGVVSVNCFRPSGTGQVHLGISGIGGPVDTSGTEVPRWIATFLGDRRRADVLFKLRKSGARECHVFVPVSFGGAPWAVESYLGRSIDVLPTGRPELPVPIDIVWITYGANGLLWSGDKWRLFDALLPLTDD